jgi:hypothetical protein
MTLNTGWFDGYVIYYIEINIVKSRDFNITDPNAKLTP